MHEAVSVRGDAQSNVSFPPKADIRSTPPSFKFSPPAPAPASDLPLATTATGAAVRAPVATGTLQLPDQLPFSRIANQMSGAGVTLPARIDENVMKLPSQLTYGRASKPRPFNPVSDKAVPNGSDVFERVAQ